MKSRREKLFGWKTCAVHRAPLLRRRIHTKDNKTEPFHRKVSRESVLWLDSLNCHVKRWFIIFAIQQNLHTFRLPYKPVDFVDLSLVQTQRIE